MSIASRLLASTLPQLRTAVFHRKHPT